MRSPEHSPGESIFTILVPVILAGVMFVLLSGMLFKLGATSQLVMILGLAFGFYFVRNPALGTVACLVARIVTEVMWWVPVKLGPLNFSELTSGSLAAGIGGLLFFNLRKSTDHPAIPLLALLGAMLCVAMLRAVAFLAGIDMLITCASPLCLMVLYWVLYSKRGEVRGIFLALLAASAIPVAISTVALLSNSLRYDLAGLNRLLGGYKSLHNHAHNMALFSALGFFWFYCERQSRWRWAALAMGILAFLCLYFTYVRTALLGLALAAGIFLLLERQYRALIIIGVSATVAFLGSEILKSRFSDFMVFLNPDAGTLDVGSMGSGRVSLWRSSLGQYARIPLWDRFIGLGLGRHWALQASFFHLMNFSSPNPYGFDTHSDTLALLYQTGPIGLVAYLGLQFQAVVYSLRLRLASQDPWRQRIAAATVALTVAVIVDNTISNAFLARLSPAWQYWTWVGLMYVEYRMFRQRGDTV